MNRSNISYWLKAVDARKLPEILLPSAMQLLKSAIISMGGETDIMPSFSRFSLNHLTLLFIALVNLKYRYY